jgi:putative folate metabolism gamma-glutamate ligase
MIVRPIKTGKILAGQKSIFNVLDEFLPKLEEQSVLAITSKIVSLCEGRVVPVDGNDRDKLVEQEADLYLPRRFSKWNFELTITKRTLVMSAGIDESNSGGEYYVLWPKDLQKSVDDIWEYLRNKHALKELGVIMTDSTCTPLRWGTTGVAIAYCGFKPKNSYIGQPDVFGRKLKVSQSNVAGGLAAAAVLCMGEGNEQTPLALVTEIPSVQFQDTVPAEPELDEYFVTDAEEDVFAPLLNSVDWQKGQNLTP